MNYNKIIIAGHLTKDVEVKIVGETAVARLSIAVSRKYKNRQGNQVEETTFIDAEAWGNTGRVISENFKKGMPILVEGKLKQANWTTQAGEKRSKHFIAIDTFSFVAKKSDGAEVKTEVNADTDIPF